MVHYHIAPTLQKRPSSDVLILPFMRNDSDEAQATCLVSLDSLGKQSSVLNSIHAVLKAGAFKGKEDESFSVYVDSPYERRVVLVGLSSKAKELHTDSIRSSFAFAISKAIQDEGISSITVALPESELLPEGVDHSLVMRGALEGVGFGLYSFSKYFKKARGSRPESVTYITSSHALWSEEIAKAKVVADAVSLARDMVNMSACEMTPEGIAQVALSLTAIPGMKVQVYDKKWIEEQKMGLFLAVAQGSTIPPRFVVIDWKGKGASEDNRTVFVGKGITFDTGGLNIKPTGSMETMRVDMGGAASVIAAMKAIGEMKLPIWVTALVPLTDNAVDGSSYRPGDVFFSREGTSVEIVSTDAEGRLILADALHYAQTEMRPARIIDVATLTGSAEIALGSEISALFSNSDSLALELEKASDNAGEPAWQMPLYRKYKPLLKSDYADLKNVAGRSGGAINAALFLEHFVGDIPWAHFDIAGTAYVKDGKRYYGKGATAVPTRTLIEYCRLLASSL